MIKHRNTRK